MKVSGARVANEQIAGMSDLSSTLAGGERDSFASLLDLDRDESGGSRGVDGIEEKDRNRPKGKKNDEGQPSTSQDPSRSAASNLPGPHVAPNIDITPWHFEPENFGSSSDEGDSRLSARLMGAANKITPGRSMSFGGADLQVIDAPPIGRPQAFGAQNPETISTLDLTDPRSLEPPKSIESKSPDATVSANDNGLQKGLTSEVVGDSSVHANGVLSPASPIDNSIVARAVQGQAVSALAGGSLAIQGSTVPAREVKASSKEPNGAIGAAEQPATLTVDGGKMSSNPTTSQPLGGRVSFSSASGHGQDGGGDPHRGSSSADGTPSDRSGAASQILANSASGSITPGASVHAHTMLTNSGPIEPARQPAPGGETKGSMLSRAMDPTTTRLLTGAMRSDLRVGVQTEAFGRVAIQTSAQGGQLTAQLSLENTKESAALAAHLPGVEQRIVQQHGLTASVRLVGGGGGAGAGSMGRDQSGSNQGNPERYRNDAGMRSMEIDHGPSLENRISTPGLLGHSYSVSSGLDVMV